MDEVTTELTERTRQTVYRGVYRQVTLPSCLVSVTDLQRLYVELDVKTREAVRGHLAELQRPPNIDQEEFDGLKERVQLGAGLTVFVWGRRGENVMITSPEAWNPVSLPREIESITFDSNSSFRSLANVDLANRFRLVVDFSGPPDFSTYNPWNEPTPNRSNLEVQGQNETWVGGVHDHVMQFLRKDRRYRGWLHSHLSYNLLHWFVGFPLSLWVVFRFSDVLEGPLAVLPDVIRIGVQIYLFLVLVNVFYFGIGLLRWLFPLVELEGTRAGKARGVVGLVLLAVVGTILYDLMRYLTGI